MNDVLLYIYLHMNIQTLTYGFSISANSQKLLFKFQNLRHAKTPNN